MSRRTTRTRCPTCGNPSMCRVARDVKTMAGKRAVIVKAVQIEECRLCGERLYDMAALERLRRARERALGTRAA